MTLSPGRAHSDRWPEARPHSLIGAGDRGGQGGGFWTPNADSSQVKYACFQGTDPVNAQGTLCTNTVVFSGPTSAGTDRF